VTEFKRRLIETTLTELDGNRTRAARALGLQRTYLLWYCPPEGFALVGFEGIAIGAG
jgi:ABC-type methionine transport system permease subunit